MRTPPSSIPTLYPVHPGTDPRWYLSPPSAVAHDDQELVQLDLSTVLNADLVVGADGSTTSGVDEENDPIDDGDRALLTQSAADQLCATDPVGLPAAVRLQ